MNNDYKHVIIVIIITVIINTIILLSMPSIIEFIARIVE
jgi:hypothetical protein